MVTFAGQSSNVFHRSSETAYFPARMWKEHSHQLQWEMNQVLQAESYGQVKQQGLPIFSLCETTNPRVLFMKLTQITQASESLERAFWIGSHSSPKMLQTRVMQLVPTSGVTVKSNSATTPRDSFVTTGGIGWTLGESKPVAKVHLITFSWDSAGGLTFSQTRGKSNSHHAESFPLLKACSVFSQLFATWQAWYAMATVYVSP